jgi:hypothetical protein
MIVGSDVIGWWAAVLSVISSGLTSWLVVFMYVGQTTCEISQILQLLLFHKLRKDNKLLYLRHSVGLVVVRLKERKTRDADGHLLILM